MIRSPQIRMLLWVAVLAVIGACGGRDLAVESAAREPGVHCAADVDSDVCAMVDDVYDVLRMSCGKRACERMFGSIQVRIDAELSQPASTQVLAESAIVIAVNPVEMARLQDKAFGEFSVVLAHAVAHVFHRFEKPPMNDVLDAADYWTGCFMSARDMDIEAHAAQLRAHGAGREQHFRQGHAHCHPIRQTVDEGFSPD